MTCHKEKEDKGSGGMEFKKANEKDRHLDKILVKKDALFSLLKEN